jgi:hypothetical protein
VKTGADLDVPGSELDNQQENVGSEDEENNYYSIGGDNHNNLDEDNKYIKKTSMKIQFNTDKTISGDENQEDYFTSLITEKLNRFQSHITRIVHLSDENGKKKDITIYNVYWKLE